MITELPQWFTRGAQVFDIKITPVLSECEVAALEVKLRADPSTH